MNSLQNSFKYLRIINLKTALNTVKECTGRVSQTVSKENLPKPIVFSPRSIGVEISYNKTKNEIKQDPIPYVPITNPRSILPLIENEWVKDEIGLPTFKKEEVEAARLIVIRKKKMKKHKRRKLWKRMRHRWARIKQKRKQLKEKAFQTELLAMMKEADEFSAENYVNDKIAQVNHTPLPKRWKGKLLPEFIIRQLMGIDKKINYKHNDVYKA